VPHLKAVRADLVEEMVLPVEQALRQMGAEDLQEQAEVEEPGLITADPVVQERWEVPLRVSQDMDLTAEPEAQRMPPIPSAGVEAVVTMQQPLAPAVAVAVTVVAVAVPILEVTRVAGAVAGETSVR
jgi:hypothetical protein